MPLQALKFQPGVRRNATTLSNEGSWFECDKVRFRGGLPEKIGGWTKDSGSLEATYTPPTGRFWGVCRSLWNWITLAGANLLGLGTHLKFYIQDSTDGFIYDITPIRTTLSTTVTDNCFTATDGSAVITVSIVGHGAQAGDFVTFSGATGINNGIDTATIAGTSTGSSTYAGVSQSATSGSGVGAVFTITADGAGGYTLDAITNKGGNYAASDTITILGTDLGGTSPTNDATVTVSTVSSDGTITAVLLNAEHQVTEYIDSDKFTITLSTSANSAASIGGGTAIDAEFQINTGNESYTVATGWGAGGWGGKTAGFSDTAWGESGATGVGVNMRLWSQSNYGENLLLNARGGPIYLWLCQTANTYNRAQVLSSTNTNTATNSQGVTAAFWQTDTSCPSKCNIVHVSDSSRFVIAFGCNDYFDTTLNPLLVRWSDQEDYSTWTPAITNQAGSFTLSAGSEIIAIKPQRQEILVFTDAAVYSMQYLGAPFVWGFQQVGANTSIVGPNAVATAANLTFWMGEDKFYYYDGRVNTLPCPLWQWVFNNINKDQHYQIFATTNEGFDEVWWFYCSEGSNTVDRYIVFNYTDKIWYYGTLDRTAWLDTPLRNNPVATGYDGSNGDLYNHEDGVDADGAAMTSYITSADFDLADGYQFQYGWRMIPDVKFDGSTSAAPQVTFSLTPRQYPGSNYGTAETGDVVSANNYTTTRQYTVQQFTDQLPIRVRGRQMAFKIESNTLGTQWQLGVPRINLKQDGRR